jgi:hypothetical protein
MIFHVMSFILLKPLLSKTIATHIFPYKQFHFTTDFKIVEDTPNLSTLTASLLQDRLHSLG